MSEPEQRNRDGLVPVGSNALVTRSSGLVKRGLELVRDGQLKRPNIRVLIGNTEKSITETILHVIKCVFKDDLEVAATCADNGR